MNEWLSWNEIILRLFGKGFWVHWGRFIGCRGHIPGNWMIGYGRVIISGYLEYHLIWVITVSRERASYSNFKSAKYWYTRRLHSKWILITIQDQFECIFFRCCSSTYYQLHLPVLLPPLLSFPPHPKDHINSIRISFPSWHLNPFRFVSVGNIAFVYTQ